jgi:uroporphyrinogen-III synthase
MEDARRCRAAEAARAGADRRTGDAIAFTTQIQCRHLFRVAAELGLCDQLVSALNANTVVAAVGPVCANVLQIFGVRPDVVPSRPKMGPMIAALAEYFQEAKH